MPGRAGGPLPAIAGAVPLGKARLAIDFDAVPPTLIDCSRLTLDEVGLEAEVARIGIHDRHFAGRGVDLELEEVGGFAEDFDFGKRQILCIKHACDTDELSFDPLPEQVLADDVRSLQYVARI